MTAINIPVTKAGNKTIAVETDQLHERVYIAALTKGLKDLANGGATNIANVKDAKTEEEKARFETAAIEKAKERVAQMYTGTLRLGREAAVKGPSGAIMTEARRIARDLIKQLIKDSGGKVSHYAASEITKAANELLADPDQGPGYIKMAEDNLAARTKKDIKFDVTKLVEDPGKVAAAEEAALKKKAGVLSAATAGKVAPRVSPAVKH